MFRKIVKFMVIAFIAMFVGCKDTVNSTPNLKGIKDFAKYKSIGVGNYKSVSSSRSANSVLIEASDAKLVGELENGEIELVKFIDEEGNTVEQTWFLTAFYKDSNFAFLSFRDYTQKTVLTGKDAFKNKNYQADDKYVIDLVSESEDGKKRGNLYSVNVFTFEEIGIDEKLNGTGITYVSGKLNNEEGVYAFSVVEDGDYKLKIEKDNRPKYASFLMRAEKDIYGNIVYDNTLYKNGVFSELSSQYGFVLNPINKQFYSFVGMVQLYPSEYYEPDVERTLKINENGEVVPNYDILGIYDLRGTIVSEDDKELILLRNDFEVIDSKANCIGLRFHKLTFNEDKTVYTNEVLDTNFEKNLVYTKIQTDSHKIMYPDTDVFTDGKGTVICYSDGKYFAYNVKTDSYTEIELDLGKLKANSTPNMVNGCISIPYADEYGNILSCSYIHPDGTVTTELKDTETNVIYLEPIA